jgi:hypothetical protein
VCLKVQALSSNPLTHTHTHTHTRQKICKNKFRQKIKYLTRRCTQNSCKKNDGVLRVAKKRKKGKERKHYWKREVIKHHQV